MTVPTIALPDADFNPDDTTNGIPIAWNHTGLAYSFGHIDPNAYADAVNASLESREDDRRVTTSDITHHTADTPDGPFPVTVATLA